MRGFNRKYPQFVNELMAEQTFSDPMTPGECIQWVKRKFPKKKVLRIIKKLKR